MAYVVHFEQMQRFDDPLLVEVLEAVRTPGGKKISEAAWKALQLAGHGPSQYRGGDTAARCQGVVRVRL